MPPHWLLMVFYYLSLLLPWLPIIPGRMFHLAYKGAAAQQYLFDDPLVYHGLKRIGGVQMLLFDLPRLQSRMKDVSVCPILASAVLTHFQVPLLILHGEDDRLANPATSAELYKQASSTDKSFTCFKGLSY
jgi:alpha-beta hydrolase superfamily lysophospholipase